MTHMLYHTIRGIHYETGQPVAVRIQDGLIAAIELLEPRDAELLLFVAPGLTDLQVNGYRGYDFNGLPPEVAEVSACASLLLAQGVTTFFPTVITNHPEQMKASLAAIDAACRASATAAACIGGIHLEGPFISPLDGPAGAHDRAFVRPPDWPLFEELFRASGERIRIITLSPEWPGAPAFIRRCTALGVLVSIGHTAAGSAAIGAAADAGAVMSTHLGNGAHPVLPRHPNYIWDQLADDRLAAGFIADGFHLPPAVMKVICRVKGDRAILVSDSVSLAGMPPGAYRTPVGGDVVLTGEGKLHVAGHEHRLAGSAQTLLTGVANLVQAGICNRGIAWNRGSVAANRLLNQPHGLQTGAPADLVLFSEVAGKYIVEATWKAGVRRYPST